MQRIHKQFEQIAALLSRQRGNLRLSNFERKRLMRVRTEAVSLDSTLVKVRPNGTGALKKNGFQAIGRS